MATPARGTFEYVAVVPGQIADRWTVRCRTAPERAGLGDGCLVGLEPNLEVEDAGLTPDPGFTRGVWRPEVMRTRLRLRASGRKGATVASASFYVDRSLMGALRSGDLLHVAGTACGGVGLSAIREGELVVAAGAVTKVPLGTGVKARVPGDLIAEAEAVVRRRDPGFMFRELPIEVSVGARTSILLGGPASIADYRVWVQHGFYPGLPGTDECLGICRVGHCPDTAANASAVLLGADRIEWVRW